MSLGNLKAGLKTLLMADDTLMALCGDATDPIHDKVAYDEAAYPLIILKVGPFEDEYTLGQRRATGYEVALICFDTGMNSADITSMADRIDTLLTDGALAVSGKTVTYCRRTGGDDDAEMDDTQTYVRIQSNFRIEVQ